MRKKAARFVEWVLSLGLGGIYLYAGGAKLIDLEQFYLDVHRFALTPPDASLLLAIYLPWLELAVGGALLIRRFYAGALAWSGAMALVFLGAISSAWWRGLDITCGCFGRAENATNYPAHLALNAAMLAATAALYWLESRRADALKTQSPFGTA